MSPAPWKTSNPHEVPVLVKKSHEIMDNRTEPSVGSESPGCGGIRGHLRGLGAGLVVLRLLRQQ